MGFLVFSSIPKLSASNLFDKFLCFSKMSLHFCLTDYLDREGKPQEGYCDQFLTIDRMPEGNSYGEGEYVKSGRTFGISLHYVDDSTMELRMNANKGQSNKGREILLAMEREGSDLVGLTMSVAGTKFQARFGIQTERYVKTLRIQRKESSGSFVSADFSSVCASMHKGDFCKGLSCAST